VIYEEVLDKLSKAESKEKVPIKDDIITVFLDFCLNLGACLVVIVPFLLLQNLWGIRLSVYLSIVVAIILLFVIGVWTQTSKSLRLKLRRGIFYAVLGVIITILTLVLGG
jgi:VIT1/CCC1 family predicted Fe2+/Mn2+ transporter